MASAIVKAGYLRKLGGKSWRRVWQKRWVVLTPRDFRYFPAEDDAKTEEPLNSVELHGRVVGVWAKKKHAFSVGHVDSESKTYYFACRSDAERSEWMQAFRDAARLGKRLMSPHLQRPGVKSRRHTQRGSVLDLLSRQRLMSPLDDSSAFSGSGEDGAMSEGAPSEGSELRSPALSVSSLATPPQGAHDSDRPRTQTMPASMAGSGEGHAGGGSSVGGGGSWVSEETSGTGALAGARPPWTWLPDRVVVRVFVRLPLDEILRAHRVCRGWRQGLANCHPLWMAMVDRALDSLQPPPTDLGEARERDSLRAAIDLALEASPMSAMAQFRSLYLPRMKRFLLSVLWSTVAPGKAHVVLRENPSEGSLRTSPPEGGSSEPAVAHQAGAGMGAADAGKRGDEEDEEDEGRPKRGSILDEPAEPPSCAIAVEGRLRVEHARTRTRNSWDGRKGVPEELASIGSGSRLRRSSTSMPSMSMLSESLLAGGGTPKEAPREACGDAPDAPGDGEDSDEASLTESRAFTCSEQVTGITETELDLDTDTDTWRIHASECDSDDGDFVEDAESVWAVLSDSGRLLEGRIESLVSFMTSASLEETEFDMFAVRLFAVFPRAVSAEDMLTLLRVRFFVPARVMSSTVAVQLVQQRVLRAIEVWLEVCPDDFFRSSEMVVLFNQFVTHAIPVHLQQALGRVLELYEQHANRHLQESTPVFLLTPGSTKKEVHQVALHLSVMEQEVFCACLRDELVGCRWMRDDRATAAPNVMKMIDTSNRVSQYLTDLILEQGDVKPRARILEVVLQLGAHMLDLGNYNGAMEVLAAVTSSPIFRLYSTWNRISDRAQTQFERIQDTLAHSSNFRGLRACIDEALARDDPRPCVPYLGVYLTDITFIEGANHSRNATLLHVPKLGLLGDIFWRLLRLQRLPRYKCDVLQRINTAIDNAIDPANLIFGDEDLRMQRSRDLEPAASSLLPQPAPLSPAPLSPATATATATTTAESTTATTTSGL